MKVVTNPPTGTLKRLCNASKTGAGHRVCTLPSGYYQVEKSESEKAAEKVAKAVAMEKIGALLA